MITIKLPGGLIATVNHGVWSVPENAEYTRLLNEPYMQPTGLGYAPTEDARMADYVIKLWKAELVSDDTPAPEPDLIY